MAKQNLTVELFYSGSWHAMPAYTRVPVRITRIRAAGSEPGPFTAALTLAGFHNPKSPFSPLYGLAGQNTPIRIKLDSSTRFYGEVSSWDPRRSINYDAAAGKGDAWTEITASGILRRLGQGTDPLRSAVFRSMAGVAPDDYVPHAYWPMEDGTGATVLASGLSGGAGMTLTGSVSCASDTTVVGSSALPTFSTGAGATGKVPTYTDTGRWFVQFIGIVPTEPAAESVIYEATSTDADMRTWRVSVEPGSPSIVWLKVYDSAGVLVQGEGVTLDGSSPSAPTEADFFGTPYMYMFGGKQSGSDLNLYFGINAGDLAFGAGYTTLPSTTLGVIREVVATGGINETVFGHSAVFVDPAFEPGGADILNARSMSGWAGETAVDRLTRLCHEEGIPITIEGSTSQAMGPQPQEKLLALFAEVERTDDGILFEPRESYGLIYRCGRERYNRAVALTLDYAANEVGLPLDPVIDDMASRNDVTVTRRDGASVRAVLESGPLSVQPPPDGIGRYTTRIDINTATDDVLPHHAWWHLSKGTVNGVRYDRVTVDLDAKPALVADAEAVDIGDVIALDNLPEDEATDRVRLMDLGYVETIGSHRRVIVFECAPATPYDIGVWGTDPQGSRWGARNTVLAEDLTDVETAADVTATGDTWITTASHPSRFPFNVDIGDLTYSCTAITGSAPNYTLTLVRLPADKAHTAGDPVTVTDTGRYGL